MKIGPWVARKRKAFWEARIAARFAVAVANCFYRGRAGLTPEGELGRVPLRVA